jgi:hypothetical protein
MRDVDAAGRVQADERASGTALASTTRIALARPCLTAPETAAIYAGLGDAACWPRMVSASPLIRARRWSGEPVRSSASALTVTLYFSRHGRLVQWPLDDLLATLAGTPVDLTELRRDFEAILTDTAPRLIRVDMSRDIAPVPVIDVADLPPPAKRPLPVVEREVAFYSPTTGTGKWHALRGELPDFMHGGKAPNDLTGPACGGRSAVDTSNQALTPPVRTPYPNVDKRICRRCLAFTDSFYIRCALHLAVNINHDRIAREFPFRPPAIGEGKWHIAIHDLGLTGTLPAERAADPACGATGQANLSPDPVIPAVGTLVSDVSRLLCRSCVKHTACWTPLPDFAGDV